METFFGPDNPKKVNPNRTLEMEVGSAPSIYYISSDGKEHAKKEKRKRKRGGRNRRGKVTVHTGDAALPECRVDSQAFIKDTGFCLQHTKDKDDIDNANVFSKDQPDEAIVSFNVNVKPKNFPGDDGFCLRVQSQVDITDASSETMEEEIDCGICLNNPSLRSGVLDVSISLQEHTADLPIFQSNQIEDDDICLPLEISNAVTSIQGLAVVEQSKQKCDTELSLKDSKETKDVAFNNPSVQGACFPALPKKVSKWKKSNKIAPKNNEAKSWLDTDDSSVVDVAESIDTVKVPLFIRPVDDKNKSTSQLDSYRNRFSFKSTSFEDHTQLYNLEGNLWNNEKVLESSETPKIGVNVNDLGTAREKKKADGTKRSRRKTEPFDFEAQAEGNFSFSLYGENLNSSTEVLKCNNHSIKDSVDIGKSRTDDNPIDKVFMSEKQNSSVFNSGVSSVNKDTAFVEEIKSKITNFDDEFQNVVDKRSPSLNSLKNAPVTVHEADEGKDDPMKNCGVIEAQKNDTGDINNTNISNNISTPRGLNGLFSGSISDTGLFVPSSSSYLDKPQFSSTARRDSLDRIFDDDYDFEVDSDESGAGSDGERCVESDDDSSDCEGSECEDGPFGALPPEPQLGNVEYKLKLVNPTKQRFEHLVTQMKWRLREGRGEALYEIGVRDCGSVRGLARRDLRASLRTLRRMAAQLGAAVSLLACAALPGTRRARAEVLVRKVPDDQHNIEVRVAVMGSNDAGKSTLVGVLTQGELDNGRGSARLNMFRHLHEVKTGRTSSVSHEILGFDPQGRPINYAYSELMTSEEITERSSKLVAFIDLAGHRKYLRTTVQGLTGYSPHYAMLVVSATAGLTQMTLEHLALVVALDLPFFVVVTKTDATPPEGPLQQLRQALAAIGCRKVALPVLSPDEVVVAASNALSRLAVPVFPVSSVSGSGLDALRWFMFLAPPAMTSAERDRLEQEPVEFQVDETFKVGDANGPVVGGLLKKGVLTERTKLLIGPLDSGDFVPICVNSLHRNKAPCRVVRAGQAAALGLQGGPPGLRQGMVLLAVPHNYQPRVTRAATRLKNCNSSPKQCESLINSETLSPKAAKRLRKKMDTSDSKYSAEDGKKSRRIKKEVNLQKKPFVSEKDSLLESIVKGIDKENTTPKENLKSTDKNKPDKLVRLSPSQYTSRFTTVFHPDAAELESPQTSSAVDIDIDNLVVDEIEKDMDSVIFEDEDNTKRDIEETTELVFDDDDNADDDDGAIWEEDPNDPRGCYFFQANVSLLYHSTAIYPGFQSTVHIGNIRQTAVIEGILSTNNVLRANDRAQVLFRFVRHPEYVVTGARVLFREALHTKGVGRVTQVFPHRQ